MDVIDDVIIRVFMGLLMIVLAQGFGIKAVDGPELSPLEKPFWQKKGWAVANNSVGVLFVVVFFRQAGFQRSVDVLGVAALFGYAILIDRLAERWPRLTQWKWLAVQAAFLGLGGLFLAIAAEVTEYIILRQIP